MTRSALHVIAGSAVRACNAAAQCNCQPDFAIREMLNIIKGGIVSIWSERLLSMAFIVRLFAVLQPLKICGLIAEGRVTDSLPYRLFADDPAAQLLAVLMGVFAVACVIEMAVFVAVPRCRIARHIRGMPYVFSGMMQAVLSAGLIASSNPSVTLSTGYLLFGLGAALLGFRIAVSDARFARVGSV